MTIESKICVVEGLMNRTRIVSIVGLCLAMHGCDTAPAYDEKRNYYTQDGTFYPPCPGDKIPRQTPCGK